MTCVADDRCDLLCLDLPRAEELRKRRLAIDTAASPIARTIGNAKTRWTPMIAVAVAAVAANHATTASLRSDCIHTAAAAATAS